MKLLLITLLVLVIIWLLGSVALYVQIKKIYPTYLSKAVPTDPEIQQIYFKNTKNQNIDAWWIPSKDSKDVILYLHGNGGRSAGYIQVLKQYANVLAPAYPGYNLSEGKPSTQSINESAELSIQFLLNKGFKRENIILWGHSLGGSPAIYLASKHTDYKKLVIINTFSSGFSMCFRQYSIFCTFTYRLHNSASWAPNVKTKIVQFHNKKDKVVPFVEGEKLFKKFTSSNKVFRELDGDHSNFDVSTTLLD